MGVVWWATHKLTFDCTLLDEDQDAGVGLLQESGLELVDPDGPMRRPRTATTDDPDEMDASLLPQRPWWKLWEIDSGEARRPHAPGVWLVYFTLASLPIFGLGQWFVPAVEEERRTGLFLYFLAYIASGMGLLLATSFLNLRRYLRQRKLKMPAAMTATWLSTGAILIVGLTAAAAVLPAAHRGLEGDRAGPREIERPPGLGTCGPQGQRRPGRGGAERRTGRVEVRGKPAQILGQGQGLGEDERSQRVTADQRPGETGGQLRPGTFQVRRTRKASPHPPKAVSKARREPPQDQSGDQGKKGDQSGEQAKGDQAKGQDGRSKDQAERGKDAEADSKQSEEKGSEQGDEKSSAENPNPSDGGSPPLQLPPIALASLAWLKGPIMVVGILILIFGLFRYGGDLLQALRALIAALPGRLLVRRPEEAETRKKRSTEAKAPPPRPFASYVQPVRRRAGPSVQPQRPGRSTASRRSKRGPTSTNWRDRPTRRRSEFVQRVGQVPRRAEPRAPRAWSDYFVTIVYGHAASRSRSCRRSASSGKRCGVDMEKT